MFTFTAYVTGAPLAILVVTFVGEHLEVLWIYKFIN